MTNMWEFLLQTLSVSVVALFLLLVKKIFEDKLSPRWQYGVWSLLAVRIFLPVRADRYVLLPMSVYVEAIKGVVERGMDSAFSNAYDTSTMAHILPVIKNMPCSITDWLFVIYVVGIVVAACYYLFSYMQFRNLLKKGETIGEATRQQILSVAEKYDLKVCQIVAIDGISSAFICGMRNPLLVIPRESKRQDDIISKEFDQDENMISEQVHLDDKVILHELLHLKHKDVWQNVFWCILRCLHWCNPFLQYVCNRIENDMESLCDQRVLERLEGEDRRDYGRILLNMANQRYARTPGTSSISNGGKNISRRIGAIVRFKKYPKGMAVVSVCIILVLMVPVLQGNAYEMSWSDYEPSTAGALEYSMAKAGLVKCETVFGALDTYAKGLLNENGVMIAVAAGEEAGNDFSKRMGKSQEGLGVPRYYLDPGEGMDEVATDRNYEIYNLTEKEDGSYEAYLAFRKTSHGMLLIPVTVTQKTGWKVIESGERIDWKGTEMYEGFPGTDILTAEGETGTVTIKTVNVCTVDNEIEGENSLFPLIDTTTFSLKPKLDAEATYAIKNHVIYEYSGDLKEFRISQDDETGVIDDAKINENNGEQKPVESVGLAVSFADKEDKEFYNTIEMNGSCSGGSTDGSYWENRLITKAWNGRLEVDGQFKCVEEEDKKRMESDYLVEVYWDSQMVEEIRVRRE